MDIKDLIAARRLLKSRLRSPSATQEDLEAFREISNTLFGGVSRQSVARAQAKLFTLPIPDSLKLSSFYSLGEEFKYAQRT